VGAIWSVVGRAVIDTKALEQRTRWEYSGYSMKSDRTWLLLALSLPVFVFSLFLPLVSVHTYCENRPIAGVSAGAAALLFLFFVRNRAALAAKKILSGVGEGLCVLAVAVNVAFVIYATMLCRHMFDQLR